jgi:hypothetical protein
VLFEALEKSGFGEDDSTNTPVGLSGLFEGHLIDYVQCKKCGHARKRRDRFMDCQVPIQGKCSLLEALSDFIKPEVLDGDNRWWCDACEAKVDADKGLAFDSGAGLRNGQDMGEDSDADDVTPSSVSSLPPLLMLSLNRCVLLLLISGGDDDDACWSCFLMFACATLASHTFCMIHFMLYRPTKQTKPGFFTIGELDGGLKSTTTSTYPCF